MTFLSTFYYQPSTSTFGNNQDGFEISSVRLYRYKQQDYFLYISTGTKPLPRPVSPWSFFSLASSEIRLSHKVARKWWKHWAVDLLVLELEWCRWEREVFFEYVYSDPQKYSRTDPWSHGMIYRVRVEWHLTSCTLTCRGCRRSSRRLSCCQKLKKI